MVFWDILVFAKCRDGNSLRSRGFEYPCQASGWKLASLARIWASLPSVGMEARSARKDLSISAQRRDGSSLRSQGFRHISGKRRDGSSLRSQGLVTHRRHLKPSSAPPFSGSRNLFGSSSYLAPESQNRQILGPGIGIIYHLCSNSICRSQERQPES